MGHLRCDMFGVLVFHFKKYERVQLQPFALCSYIWIVYVERTKNCR